MSTQKLQFDPFNIIVTGVGGQGNVLASRIVGDMLCREGFDVTIGETFGASQRGGSVMSHVRASSCGSVSPQIPLGNAHIVVSLEPVEALRVLQNYGNENVKVITNMRPMQPVGVITGELDYPSSDKIKGWIKQLSKKAWFIDTTEAATKLGNPIFGNVILVGALAGIGERPLTRDQFEAVVRSRMPASKVAVNMEAFDIGVSFVK
jgi:indolepyruvate ferredoxin oxidoreductase beta subunit